jgi:hypothetical protein
MRHNTLGFIFAMLAISAIAAADNTSALINEALDKQVKLDINATLPQAMAAISNQTGVPLRAEQAVWDLLPWGEQTNITAKIENQTLRQSLDVITRKLGLIFVVKDESVELQPMPPLRRLGRRATVQELQALDVLASMPRSNESVSAPASTLLRKIDKDLEAMKSPFVIENRAGDELGKTLIQLPRNSSPMDCLESMARQTNATWYPWGKSIVIIHKDDMIRGLLGKTISVRYNGVDVSQVLMDLSQRSGVDFSIEPGAVQRIAPQSRNINLVLDNTSIQQALESIAGFTGLGYAVKETGVYIWNPSQAIPGQREKMVGLLQLDNGMQVLVPESQVPPDVREYLQYKTKKEIEKIRKMMEDENFKPTPKPATQPAPPADERL